MFSNRPLVLVIGFCALLTLVGLLAVPWVSFESPEHVSQRVLRFEREGSVQEILRRVPVLGDALGIQPEFTPGQIETLFADPDQQRLVTLAQHHGQLTGWMMWRFAPQLGWGLSWGIPLAAVSILLLLLTMLVAAVFKNTALIKSMLLLSSIGALLSLLLLLVYLPRVDTFGTYDDLSLIFLCFLLGTETRAGIYVVLAGLGPLATGSAILFINTVDATSHDDDDATQLNTW